MKFVTIRDFRTHSARIQRELPDAKEMILTSSGKPVAIISSVSEDDLEETLAAIRRARAILAISMLQAASVKRGTDKISLKKINAEITDVRRKRRKQ